MQAYGEELGASFNLGGRDVPFRPFEADSDKHALFQRMLRTYEKNKDKNIKQWLKNLSFEEFVESAIDVYESGDYCSVIINETYVFGFWIEETMYVGRKCLIEKTVQKIYDGPGTFDDVIGFMEYACKKLGCHYVTVGTSTADNNALIKKYNKYGFEVSEVHLTKEVN